MASARLQQISNTLLNMAPKLNENGIPSFDDLPLRPGDPHHSAWGLYGEKDELGTLNRLTDDKVVAAARNEIQKGIRVSLNWPLDAQGSEAGFFQRKLFHKQIIHKAPRAVHDDVWEFNSQVSSQWDGFRHFAYQKEALFYNGVTVDQISGFADDNNSHHDHGPGHGSGPGSCKSTTINGIQAFAEKGIVGRGILVDLASWRASLKNHPEEEAATAEQERIRQFDCFETNAIPLRDLQACLRAQGTVPQFGDILLVRTGWHAQLAQLDAATLAAHQQRYPHHFGGVEQSEEMIRWIWETFSAVAGDQPSFEAWPTQRDWSLHEVLLAGYGCPIGELFWLETLAETCKREGRWSFFVSSEVCNVPGGVASPPNILAIF